jgi:uncharacterized protein (TIGR03118 family)
MNARFGFRTAAALLSAALMISCMAPTGAFSAYYYPPPPSPPPPMTPPSTPSTTPTTTPSIGPNAYLQENLVSDVAGTALQTDAHLVNPWGIAPFPNGPLWIADNGTGLSTLYQANGQPAPSAGSALVVTLPVPSGSGPAAPTGIVFNGTTGFALQANQPALIIFATEDGTVSGWNPNVDQTHALLKVDNSAHAVYKGLALAGSQLFAANFRENSIDVFNSDFSPAGSFTDPAAPAGFAPFGIQNLGGTLYVTYAKQDTARHDDVKGAGNGVVDIFHPDTHSFTRLITGQGRRGLVLAPLNSPWGLAMAPDGFGMFSHDLLVGNFGDGQINAFDPNTGQFKGALQQPSGQPVAIEGLWGLFFDTDPAAASQPLLFFTAGIGGEQHGLLGRLRASGG